MSGRRKFVKYSFLIAALSFFFRLLPLFFRRTFYRSSFILVGTVGVLIRYCINRCSFSELGSACYFGAYTVIKNEQGISVGDRCSFHEFCYIDGSGGLKVGNDVSFAHGCSIVTFEHGWSDPASPIKYNPVVRKSVVIENDVWMGAGVKVLAGSYVESRVIVAAGAVVKGRLKSGWIYGGVPARQIKRM